MADGKVCTIVLLVFLITGAVVSMAILIVAAKNMDNSSWQFIRDIGYNWSQSPMTDLSLSDSSSECQKFITDSWPGTETGCDCDYGNPDFIERGFCTDKEENKKNCDTIPSIKPMPYNVYDSKQICKKTGKNNYLNLTVATGCPSSYPQKCGIIDSLENFLCIPSNQSCPINDLQFVPLTSQTPADYKSLLLGSRKIIYTNTKTSNKIAIQTKISDNQPCAYKGEENDSVDPFILDENYGMTRCKTVINGQLLNPFYSKVDTISYSSLLQQNSILGRILSTIPTYPSARINRNTSLWVKSYIGLKSSCKANLLQDIKNDVSGYISNLQAVGVNAVESLNLGTITLGLAISTFCLIIVWGVVRLVFMCACSENDKEGVSFTFLMIVAIIELILCVVTIGFASAFSAKINGIGNAHHLLVGCLDAFAEEQSGNFILNVPRAQKFSTVGAILSALVLVTLVIEIVVWRCTTNSHSSYNNTQRRDGDDEFSRLTR